MKNNPTYEELWERVKRADDLACDGGWQDSDCPFCQGVVKVLRGGSDFCPDCGHINALGHDCAHWVCGDHDAGEPCVPSDVPWPDGPSM